ncbi:hypothetical protein PvNV_006 [Penaeus vannamei nudivirus]|nr:hypothetical protein PvSNPV_006 [Penaeus vannamei nucleopolyhedrovirus]
MLIHDFVILPTVALTFNSETEGNQYNKDLINVIVTFIKIHTFSKYKASVLYNLKFLLHKHRSVWSVNYVFSSNGEETPYTSGVQDIVIPVPQYTTIFVDYQPEEDLVLKPKVRKLIIKPKPKKENTKNRNPNKGVTSDSKIKKRKDLRVFSAYTEVDKK